MPVFVTSHVRLVEVGRPPIERLVSKILSAMRELRSDLSVTFVGDRRMRRLNRRYRHKDRTTDVLAFAMRDTRACHNTTRLMSVLGDVVIALPAAVRQARRGNRSLDDEIASLLVHGILHLCGYDHERNEAEARRMYRRERTILKRLGSIPRLARVKKSEKHV